MTRARIDLDRIVPSESDGDLYARTALNTRFVRRQIDILRAIFYISRDFMLHRATFAV